MVPQKKPQNTKCADELEVSLVAAPVLEAWSKNATSDTSYEGTDTS